MWFTVSLKHYAHVQAVRAYVHVLEVDEPSVEIVRTNVITNVIYQ